MQNVTNSLKKGDIISIIKQMQNRGTHFILKSYETDKKQLPYHQKINEEAM